MGFGGLGKAHGRMGGAGRPSTSLRILLSANSQNENTATDTTIGTLSVVNGTGVYTLSKTADPDSAFTLTGAALKNAISFDYETATSHSVTIHADNGAGSTVDGTFSIAVLDVVEASVFFILREDSGKVLRESGDRFVRETF